jgi:hypothetical protein
LPQASKIKDLAVALGSSADWGEVATHRILEKQKHLMKTKSIHNRFAAQKF